MFQTLKLIPSKVWFIDGEVLGVLAFGLLGLVWLLLPFLESDQPSRTKSWITGFAVSCSCLHGRYECLWPSCEIASDHSAQPAARGGRLLPAGSVPGVMGKPRTPAWIVIPPCLIPWE